MIKLLIFRCIKYCFIIITSIIPFFIIWIKYILVIIILIN